MTNEGLKFAALIVGIALVVVIVLIAGLHKDKFDGLSDYAPPHVHPIGIDQGVCCVGQQCSETTPTSCKYMKGNYGGNGTTCAYNGCCIAGNGKHQCALHSGPCSGNNDCKAGLMCEISTCVKYEPVEGLCCAMMDGGPECWDASDGVHDTKTCLLASDNLGTWYPNFSAGDATAAPVGKKYIRKIIIPKN